MPLMLSRLGLLCIDKTSQLLLLPADGDVFACFVCCSVFPGIDFLVNAVWPELVSLLTNQAPTIFAAGNPDVFHSVSF